MQMQVIAPSRAPAALLAIAVQGVLIYGLGASLGVVPKVPVFEPPVVDFYPTDPVKPVDPPREKLAFSPDGITIPTPFVPQIVAERDVPIAREKPEENIGGTAVIPEPDATFSQARILRSAEPPYPFASIRRGEEGMVYVRIWLSASGRIDDAKIERSSGFANLDEAALKAVRTWRFAAAMSGGQGVNTSVIVPVKFELRK